MKAFVLCLALTMASGSAIASGNDGTGSEKGYKPAVVQWEAAFHGFLCRYFGLKCAMKGETQGTNKSGNDGTGSGD